MAKIIVKIPYIKNKSASTYTGYIATREGVDKSINVDLKIAPPTEKQMKFIDEYIIKLPDAKELFEYEDYIKNPTIQNASKFISAATEQNSDMFEDSEIYVNYIATRPHAEKLCEHGLFGANDNIDLEKVKKEIKNLQGNCWTPIISLRREDAQRLGYDNAESWHNLIMAKQIEFAKALDIPLSDLRWYAAYHDEGYHPHCHMVMYSVNPRQGYLAKQGIQNIKSALANEIFKQDLQQLYSKKTISRDKVSDEAKKKIKKLVDEINGRYYGNSEICNKLILLSEALKGIKGKKQYGYLPANIKKMVDDIVKDISNDENISELYKNWCDIQNKIIGTYKSDFIEHPPIWQNKEFKKIRNAVVFEALKIGDDCFFIEGEADGNQEEIIDDIPKVDERKQDYIPNNNKEVTSSAPPVVMSVFNLFSRLSKMIENSCNNDIIKHFSSQVDKKTMKKIAEKKAEQGLKF